VGVFSQAQTFDREAAAKAWLNVGRTTDGDNLRLVNRRKIAKLPCQDITSRHQTEFARDLYDEGRQPATVGNILSSLGKVFTLGNPMWGYPLDEREMVRAVAGCRELGLVDRSARRKRRPELYELDRLFEHFAPYEVRRSDALPMRRLTAFGIYSTRRHGETCRLQWKDYEPDHKDGPRILVRDMKHRGRRRETMFGAASRPRRSRSSL
jgi:integrase